MKTGRPLVAAVALAALFAAGCSDDDPTGETTPRATSTTTTLVAPGGDAFYTPPDPLPSGAPGDLIWAGRIEGPEGTRAWRILYRSTTVKGEPIAVSGLLFAPDPPPAASPVPILAVAHGTTGLADRCAPSKLYETNPRSTEMAYIPPEVLSRYVLVASDYEGLGTPGVHPYAIGLSEGRNVLDSIRAAQRVRGIGTSAASDSVVFGHSQGGGAALFAAELAATYAPDANLVGAVAGAPAAELQMVGRALRTSPFFGYTFMGAAGFKAAYPELDLDAFLTPAGIDAVENAGEQCGAETIAAFRGKDPNLYLEGEPSETEPLATLIEQNSPARRATDVPIFVYHGEVDEQIPVDASARVLERYCANGTTAYRKTWPGATHVSVIFMALPEIHAYLADRLEGKPPPTSC